MTRWAPEVARLPDGPPSDPDRVRREAQAQWDRGKTARERGAGRLVAALQEAPTGPRRSLSVERPAQPRPAPVLEPYAIDEACVLDQPGQLVVAIPGRPVLVNQLPSWTRTSPDGKRRTSAVSLVRAHYRDLTVGLCHVFRPRPRDVLNGSRWEIVVHQLWHAHGRRQQPDAGAVTITAKGILDGLQEAGVVANDRDIAEVYPPAVASDRDLLLVTLRASPGYPLPILTVPVR